MDGALGDYLSRKSGAVDAQENPLANTVAYGAHKLHRYHTLSGHFYLSRGLYMNRAQFVNRVKPLHDEARSRFGNEMFDLLKP